MFLKIMSVYHHVLQKQDGVVSLLVW